MSILFGSTPAQQILREAFPTSPGSYGIARPAMGFVVNSLWKAPEVNPINHKARSIPGLNPFNVYGRVFFFSWFGFMIAFWSWYAISPPQFSCCPKT